MNSKESTFHQNIIIDKLYYYTPKNTPYIKIFFINKFTSPGHRVQRKISHSCQELFLVEVVQVELVLFISPHAHIEPSVAPRIKDEDETVDQAISFDCLD